MAFESTFIKASIIDFWYRNCFNLEYGMWIKRKETFIRRNFDLTQTFYNLTAIITHIKRIN